MRHHAEASIAKTTQATGMRRGFFGLVYLCVLGLVAFGGGASAAEAAAPGEIPGRGFLPDNRGWEKVSADDKNGVDVKEAFAPSAERSPDTVSYGMSFAPSPESEAGIPGDRIRATRDPQTGWSSESVLAPIPPNGSLYALYTDLAHDPASPSSVQESFSALTSGATKGADQLYLRDNESGTYQLLTPMPGELFAPDLFTGLKPLATIPTADFTHVAYETPVVQTLEPVNASSYNVYEWVEGEGARLVGLVPGPTETECGGTGPACEIPAEGTRLGAGLSFGIAQNSHSADGERIFFHSIEPGDFPLFSSTGQLYVREGGTVTKRISVSQRTDCADDPTCGGDGEPDPAPHPVGPQPVAYEGAEAEHGSSVIFKSCEPLTDDSNLDPTEVVLECPAGDLYKYDVDSGSLEDLTSADPDGGGFLGTVAYSDDLERIYYVALGDLAPGATDGQPNLYLWDHGVTKFIATLSTRAGTPTNDPSDLDSAMWNHFVGNVRNKGAAQTTPSGSYLVFRSEEKLTGYDNTNPNCNNAESCPQLFRYEASSGEIECISCNLGPNRTDPSDDIPPASDPYLFDQNPSLDSFHGALPGNLTHDGSQVFFHTDDALVKADSNGKTDVYRWKDGDVALISAGSGGNRSQFLSATPSGSDVYFTTRDRLVGSDRDQSIDVYDARVDGGFPEPIGGPACEGDACLTPPVVPIDPTPASSSFLGAGDVRSTRARARCAKSKVQRKGRCVAKKQRKARKNRANNDRRTSR